MERKRRKNKTFAKYWISNKTKHENKILQKLSSESNLKKWGHFFFFGCGGGGCRVVVGQRSNQPKWW